jgi:hypothetical protein
VIRRTAAVGFCLALWSAGSLPVAAAADPITEKIER